MNLRELFSRYGTLGSVYGTRLKRIWGKVWKVLTFNLVEGVIIPKKCLSVTLEKGAVSVAYGTLFLSKPRIKKFKRHLLDEDRLPGPEHFASVASRAIEELKASGAEITLSLPHDLLVVRTAELPVVVKENITSVVSYELDRLNAFCSQ